jgi:hypothetical protein
LGFQKRKFRQEPSGLGHRHQHTSHREPCERFHLRTFRQGQSLLFSSELIQIVLIFTTGVVDAFENQHFENGAFEK